MHESVDYDLADRLDRDRVSIAPTYLAEHCRLVGMLEQELHDPIKREGHWAVNLGLVEDVGPGGATQPAALDPRGGQEAGGVGARGEKAYIRRDDLASLLDGEPKRDEIIDIGTAPAQLRQRLQIEIIQRGSLVRQVFECHAARVAFKFCHQGRISLACRRSQTNIDTVLGVLIVHEMRTASAQMDGTGEPARCAR